MKGFTLIEVMVVIAILAILGILAAIALPAYQDSKCRQAGTATKNGKCVRTVTRDIATPVPEAPIKQTPPVDSLRIQTITQLSMASACTIKGRYKFVAQGIEYDITCSRPYTREVK